MCTCIIAIHSLKFFLSLVTSRYVSRYTGRDTIRVLPAQGSRYIDASTLHWSYETVNVPCIVQNGQQYRRYDISFNSRYRSRSPPPGTYPLDGAPVAGVGRWRLYEADSSRLHPSSWHLPSSPSPLSVPSSSLPLPSCVVHASSPEKNVLALCSYSWNCLDRWLRLSNYDIISSHMK